MCRHRSDDTGADTLYRFYKMLQLQQKKIHFQMILQILSQSYHFYTKCLKKFPAKKNYIIIPADNLNNVQNSKFFLIFCAP